MESVNLTKSLLKEYANAVKELNEIDRKITYYSKMVTPAEHGVVRGSMREYPYAEKHFVLSGSDIKSDDARQEKIKQLLITLSESRERYNNIVIDIGVQLESIPDSETRSILFMKYVESKTDLQIAQELGYERSTITRKINNFLG